MNQTELLRRARNGDAQALTDLAKLRVIAAEPYSCLGATPSWLLRLRVSYIAGWNGQENVYANRRGGNFAAPFRRAYALGVQDRKMGIE